MGENAKKPGVRLQDVAFYFDAVERDRIDAAGWDRRSAEVLALRDRLLRMPASEFEATIKTIKNVVSDAAQGDGEDDGKAARQRRQRQGSALFEQVKGGGRASKVDKVSGS